MTVLLVGDSWVSDRKLGIPLASALGVPVRSAGFPGATTAEIADRIEPVGADVLVTVAGVNDAIRHVGPGAYAAGMRRIAEVAAWCGAVPVLCELPRFAIRDVPGRSLCSRCKLLAMRLVNDGGCVDIIDRYRAALRRSVTCAIVPAPEYGPGHWHDPAHINADGRMLLVSAIANEIGKVKYEDMLNVQSSQSM